MALTCVNLIRGQKCGDPAKLYHLGNGYIDLPVEIPLCEICRDSIEHGDGMTVEICTNPAQLQLVQ